MLLTTATLACSGLKQGFHSQLEIEVLPQAERTLNPNHQASGQI